jgi:hypothetical protein
MGNIKRPVIHPAPAEKGIPDILPGVVNDANSGYPPVVFSSILEFCIVFLGIVYSLFCFNAWLLDAGQLKLSVVNLIFLLGVELLLLGSVAYKKIQVIAGIKTCLYGILVFILSFLISLNVSPALLPISWSSDYPHHYILIEFLSTHEQLPQLTSGLGEMVQYPFGASLFTSVAAKIIPLSLMTMMGFLAAVVSALIALIIYMLGRKLLEQYTDEKNLTDMVALVSAFMVFSVPVYFLDQYCVNFYYSMIFGELLVLLTLLALMNAESGSRPWMYVFILATIGIIFTYTLFIVIPASALVLYAILNPEKTRVLADRIFIVSGLLVMTIFLLFSYERLGIGTHILQYEGLTVEPNIMNFPLLFIILVISGIILGLKFVPGYLRSALFVYYIVMIAEFFAFIVLDHYGLVAIYYANKIFYLLVLALSVSASFPVYYVIRYIGKEQYRTAAAVCIIALIGIFSLFIALPFSFPASGKPIVTNEHVIFTQKAEVYLRDNNIPYENLSIHPANLNGYWLRLLLHMDKDYAQKQISNPILFSDWLKSQDARYVVCEMDKSYPEFFEIQGVRIQIVVREGQLVLVRKVE